MLGANYLQVSEPLAPNGTIGILGGGQLGRMLAMAGAVLGYRIAIYEPDPKCPAVQVANLNFANGWDDEIALEEFAFNCDVITYEFENVPLSAARFLADLKPLNPGTRALEVAQDRLIEKNFLNEIGIKTAPFEDITNADDFNEALNAMGGKAILKTRRLGYDGKGQIRFGIDNEPALSADQALTDINNQPAVLEGFVPFKREISVIVVRSIDGQSQCYDPAENVHKGGILRTSTVPAQSSPDTLAKAKDMAKSIAISLNYSGALGVEFFEMEDGSLLVNEIAPRVHNSGHWTEAACVTSQFENHMRAVAGLPVLPCTRHSDCVMENIIGDDMDKLANLVTKPDARLHLYGKRETRPGRKMGHITYLSPSTL